MGTLEGCQKIYEGLLNKDYILTLETGIQLQVFFSLNNFKHLLGLHKLAHESNLMALSSSTIYRKIMSGEIKNNDIQNCASYDKIHNRIDYFDRLPKMMEKSKIIIDFNPNLVERCELQNTKYILYKKIGQAYINLTLGMRNGALYPETFIYEPSKRYINGQVLLDIIDIQVIEKSVRRHL